MSPFGHVRRHLSLMLSCLTVVVLMWANKICAATTNFSGPGASVVATIPIPSVPPGGNAGSADVQINLKTNRVYVTNDLSVTVLDGVSDTIIANIPIPSAAIANLTGNTGLYQSCVDDVTNTVYSLAEIGVVTVIDGASNTIKGTFAPLPTSTITNVDGIACNPETGKLYMVLWNPGPTGNGQPNVVVWDTKKQQTVAVLVVTNHEEWLAVNRKTNRIYAQTDFEGVVVIDGATDKVIDRINVGLPQPPGCQSAGNCVNPGSWLEQVAVDEETNRIYVVGIQDGSLTTIDGQTNKVIAQDYYDYFPYSVAVDPARNRIYTLDVTLNVLTEVDGASGKRRRNVSVSPGPFPLGCVSGFVQLNPNTRCIASSAGTVGGLQGIATNPVSGKIYVTYTGAYYFVAGVPNAYSYLVVVAPTEPAGGVASVEASPNTANTPKEVFARAVTLAAGSNVIDAAINTQTNTLYIANSGSNTVSAFNLSSLAVTATIPVGASPRAITINESTNALYTFNADGSVSALDANQNNLVSNFPVDANAGGLLGLNPRAIAYSRRSGKIYAINGFNQIDVVDPRSARVLTTIPDVDASNVAINQGTNIVYVSQYSSGAVWVIDGATDKVVDVIRDVGQEAQPAGCYRLAGGPNSCLEMSSGLTKLAVDETLDRVYVLGEYDGRIVTIDGKTDQVIGKRFINPGDYGLAVDPRAHTVFADNFMTPALWILDGQTGQIGDVVNFNSRVCDTANSSCFDQSDLKSVTVNPATGGIYVLDQGDLNPKGTSLLYLVKPTLAP